MHPIYIYICMHPIYIYISYIYILEIYICTRGGIHHQHYDMWVCLKMGDISLISGKLRRNIINID